MQNSFNKYGEDAFEFGVIEYCNPDKLDELEIAYMNLYNVKINGFNICDGGTHKFPDNSNENHGMFRQDISNDKLKELYLQDYNSKQLSKMFHCSYRTINRRLNKIFGEEKYNELKKQKQSQGIKKKNRFDPNISNEDILKLANDGYNSVEIANQLGCSDSTVMSRLKKVYSPTEYENYKNRNTKIKMANLREKVTDESKRKIALSHKKYNLWDGSKVHYTKNSFKFYLRYNGTDIKIGSFCEFVSIEIIHNLIEEVIANV